MIIFSQCYNVNNSKDVTYIISVTVLILYRSWLWLVLLTWGWNVFASRNLSYNFHSCIYCMIPEVSQHKAEQNPFILFLLTSSSPIWLSLIHGFLASTSQLISTFPLVYEVTNWGKWISLKEPFCQIALMGSMHLMSNGMQVQCLQWLLGVWWHHYKRGNPLTERSKSIYLISELGLVFCTGSHCSTVKPVEEVQLTCTKAKCLQSMIQVTPQNLTCTKV